ncbi:hypothetical protein [Corynebacterium dentalis]|uniref:hypothetical protein n=1 Tax=Corynebacterium dentalis TaxID=2014528 RepID=UPI00289EA659|nr:hypothetical protein [Corynebacterium dentalis]
MTNRTLIVAAPTPVRAATSILLGLAVAVMAMPIPNGFKVIGLVVCVAAGLMVTFSHPYRRRVRAAVEERNEKYTTTISQVLPLFPLWLALMVLPIITGSWVLAAIVWVIAAAYAWFVHPQLDGTAHIRPLADDNRRA